MASLANGRLLFVAVVFWLVVAACTSSAPTTPPPAASPAAAKPGGSPSPVAQTTPTSLPAPVGGGAAQPRAPATSAPIGAQAIVVVATPNFAIQATSVPAGLAPAVGLQTVVPAQPANVTGTLSRVPTPIPPPPNAAQLGAIATATASAGGLTANLSVIISVLGGAAGGGGGGGGGAQNVPAVQTATPPVRLTPQAQPTLAFPSR